MKLFSFLLLLILSFSLPGFAQDAEDDVERIIQAKKRQQESMDLILKGPGNGKNKKKVEVPSDLPPEIQALGYKEITVTDLGDRDLILALQKMFRNSPLQKMTNQEVRNLMLNKYSGTSTEEFLSTHPDFHMCIVDILKDKEAMASMLGIFLRQGDLFIYALIWIGYMLMGHALKKLVIKEDMKRIERTVISLGVSLLISIGTFYSFYKIFHEELSPTVTIVRKHWNGPKTKS